MRYKGEDNGTRQGNLKQISKDHLSSDCRLELVYMKSESLVIVNHDVTVNDLSNFAHTAHHARRVVTAGNFIRGQKGSPAPYTTNVLVHWGDRFFATFDDSGIALFQER